jgi:hypothetical protein
VRDSNAGSEGTPANTFFSWEAQISLSRLASKVLCQPKKEQMKTDKREKLF